MTDETPVNAAALLLDPSCRGPYHRKNLPAAWVQPPIEAANTFWQEIFNIAVNLDAPLAPPTMPPPEVPSKKCGVELDLLLKGMEVITSDSRDVTIS
jgi:hypothetical protein